MLHLTMADEVNKALYKKASRLHSINKPPSLKILLTVP
jgi:hypothetical protein